MNAASSPHLRNSFHPIGAVLRALFRVLLLVCPREMRREYGTAILGDFDERFAAATTARGTVHANAFGFHALLDLTASGVLERFTMHGLEVGERLCRYACVRIRLPQHEE